MQKKFFKLTVVCDAATPDYIVDGETLASFERSFDKGEETIIFSDLAGGGEVKLRNKRLAGYKKAPLADVPAELKRK
ncbi:MAG: hypothetical protein HZB82_09645 [Deltaproteobacteria bacterium]|nr:hypothetical protein [Deltaproteobacteria bacterium]